MSKPRNPLPQAGVPAAGASASPSGGEEAREPVLDVVDRVSEMCFWLVHGIDLRGRGLVRRARPRCQPHHAACRAGLQSGWGLVDAVMYLVRTLASRGQRLTLAHALRNAADGSARARLVRDALPRSMKALVAEAELEAMHTRLASARPLPERSRLHWADFRAAAYVFGIVVLSTFPVVLPFVIWSDVATALFVSRSLTLAMLFVGGTALGHYAGFGGVATGLGMTALGVVLTMAIIALGG